MSDETRPNPLAFPPPEPHHRSPEPQRAVSQPPPEPSRAAVAIPRERSFRRGFGLGAGLALGFGLVTTIACALGFALLVLSSLALVRSGDSTATTSLTTIWGTGSKTLRAIPINGVIMGDASEGMVLAAGTYGSEIAEQLDGLAQEDAAGVVLLVDTPGGSIGGSRAISDAVVRYQERTGHKVLVHVAGLSASGGVYSTAPADEIIADHGSLVGSIGVIMGPFMQYNGVTGTTGTLLQSGVTTTGGITSEVISAGTGKDFGNAWRPMTPEEKAHYQAGIDNEYANFVAHVAQYRDIAEETIVNELGAYIFDNARAEAVGLIDASMGRDEFFRHAAEAVGLDPNDTKVEAIDEPSGLEVLLGATRAYGVAPAAQQGAGIVPVVNQSICGAREPLVLTGDLVAVCG